LQVSLYPEFYLDRSAQRDLLWVRKQDSSLVDFWNKRGSEIIYLLSEFSGIEWEEAGFDIYFTRFYPTFGEADPLISPIGGRKRGTLIEASPIGVPMQLNLIYQLARRLLAQPEKTADDYLLHVSGHPLMQATPFRRDHLALLLTLVTAQELIGLDSTYDAYQSAIWRQMTPAREIFERFLLTEWILTPERPLIRWIEQEPYRSRLVAATSPPKPVTKQPELSFAEQIEGLPTAGNLGFSLRIDARGGLTIDKIDIYRLAYTSGFREGDVFRQVDGVRVRNHKDLIEKILAGLNRGEAVVEVVRDEQTELILMQPFQYSDEHYPLDWNDADSLFPLEEYPVSPEDSSGGN
jgi:hypothetical protein